MPHRSFLPYGLRFFPSTSGRKISARFFLPPAAPKTLTVKGSMMKLASPTLFSLRRDPTHPSQLHLRHKNTYFRSRSGPRALRALAHSLALTHSTTFPISAANELLHIVAPPCRSRSRFFVVLNTSASDLVPSPVRGAAPFPLTQQRRTGPSFQPAG